MALTYIETEVNTMTWFKELRKGQKILFLINAVLIIALFVMAFSGIGLSELFAMGFIIGFFNTISIIFARGLFKFGIDINTENAGDDVEPSEWKYLDWYIKWGFSTLAEIAVLIFGIVLKK